MTSLSQPVTPEEETVCHICANSITYLSLSPCLHTTCHICALRLRALYKSHSCTVCKQPQPRLLFLLPETLEDPTALTAPSQEEREKVFDHFLSKCPFSDEALAIAFESLPIKQATLGLLRFNCPYSALHLLTDPDSLPPKGAPEEECTFVALRGGFPELARHTRERHGRMLCELCVRSKKIFAHEHVLYTPRQLLVHLPSLPRPPYETQRGRGARGRGRGRGAGANARQEDDEDGEEDEDDDSVEWSHPMCAFDRECFASSDELYAHLREAHEECFLCRRAGLRDVYFQNYPSLEAHFSSAHHPCPHPACLQQHFVVFPTAMDLKAHYVETHGSELTQRELREMRGVEGMFADSSVPGAPGSSGAAASSGRGRRGRFGAALTTDTLPENDNSREALDTLQRQPLTDAQAAAWQALLKPLPVLPPTQLLALRSSLLAWLSHQSGAKDLLTILASLLTSPASPSAARRVEPEELVLKALQHLANHGQLTPDSEQDLRSAINAFKADRTAAFPSLSAGGDFAAIASGRGIPAPSATGVRAGPAGTGRTRGGAQRTVWDRVEHAAQRTVPLRTAPAQTQTQTASFPALSSSAIVAPAPRRPGGASSTAWSAASASSSARPTPVPVPVPIPYSVHVRPSSTPTASTAASSGRRAPAPAPTDGRAFPGLPSRETARVPLGAQGGNSSLRNILGHQEGPGNSNSWGRPLGGGGLGSPTEGGSGAWGGGGPAVAASATGQGGGAVGSGGGGKKKRKGKETLFTLGSFPT